MNFVLAILAFSVLIIGHELGHFTLAKLNGIKVEEFSVGMGPKLFGVKFGETEYMLKLFPVGAYVKMLGEEEKDDDPRSFSAKSPLGRLSVIAAGPVMNLILALVFNLIIVFNAGSTGYSSTIINEVVKGSPAEETGLLPGDEIIKIGTKKIHTWNDISFALMLQGQNTQGIEIKRDGQKMSLPITPIVNTASLLEVMENDKITSVKNDIVSDKNGEHTIQKVELNRNVYKVDLKLTPINGEIKENDEIISVENSPSENGKSINQVITLKRDGETQSITVSSDKSLERKVYMIGISPKVITNPSFFEALSQGYKQTLYNGSVIFDSFKMLFTGKASFNDVGGPITIVRVSAAAAESGIMSLLNLAALLSVNLAIFNLIPFPALDGGWITLLLFELITGKKPNSEKIGYVNFIGFSILMTLAAVILLKDIFFPVQF